MRREKYFLYFILVILTNRKNHDMKNYVCNMSHKLFYSCLEEIMFLIIEGDLE